jgi:sortase A
VVAGVERDDLAKGPGHYPDTPMPGDVGNAAIAGHRTTFGAPFNRIDELRSGDSIDVTTLAGIFHYKVNQAPKVVFPTDLSVLDPTPTATLTLTSCHPKFSARQRIVVTASLDLPSSPVPQVAPATTTAPPPGPSSSPNTVAPAVPDSATVSPPHKRASDVSAGWLDERGAIAPTMLFFAVCVLVVIAARRAWRRRQGWYWQVAAVVAFLPALYFFYENLARLLPSNL